MANFSDLTRKEQVLAHLQRANGGWVDGPELATEEVGGSEGLRRLRELADEGHNIRKRKHPDAERDIWQYRLAPRVAPPTTEEARKVLGEIGERVIDASVWGASRTYEIGPEGTKITDRPAPAPAEPPVYPKHDAVPQTKIADAIRRKEDGTYEYVPPQRPITGEQLTTPPDPPQPEGTKFESLPRRINYGEVATCPRCHSKTTRGRPSKPKDEPAVQTAAQRRKKERQKDEGSQLVDRDGIYLFRDPHTSKVVPCGRCNGYGIVPNVGPIPVG